MSSGWPRFTSVADHAVLVEFAAEIDDDAHAAVVALDHALGTQPLPGMVEVVPAYVSLLVDFDPVVIDHGAVRAAIEQTLAAGSTHRRPEPATHLVHVCFDEDFGPDLAEVAATTGLPIDGVVDAFLAGDYRVVMYGFAPGYAYLDGGGAQIQVPRKASPVRGVAAGSVIVTGRQCLVTTIEMPTGWSILGRSPTSMMSPDAADPFLAKPGDRIRFERIDRPTYEQMIQ